MKTKIFTLAGVRKLEEEALKRGAKISADNAIDMMNACTAITLMDKFDFTPEMLRKFMEYNNEKYEAVASNEITFEELKQVCRDEFGIEFREV